ncbi:MAG: cupin domain-containing protein [Sulfuricaulis sp.]
MQNANGKAMIFHLKSESSMSEVLPGYLGRFVHGQSITVAHWEIKAGFPVPEHSHYHEQLVNCLAGEFELSVNGVTRVMKPGDTAVIPPYAIHSGRAITDARCLDIFCPIREDYRL